MCPRGQNVLMSPYCILLRGNMTVLVCHVIFQDQVIEALNDFIVRIPLKKVTILSSLALRHCCSEDVIVLVCHAILQDHVFKGACDFMGMKASYHSSKFGGHRHSCSRDIRVFVCLMIVQEHIIKLLNDFWLRSL